MINRFSMRCRTNLTGVILLVATSWSLGVSAELPRSALVDSAQSSDDGVIRLVLGGIENVPRGIVAENEILLEGRQSANVFEAPPSMSHEAVRDALVANRADRLQQQFSCDGRACGSSGDWANGILGYRILYGPEQYQHYWVGRDASGKRWESVYVGRRGNGKVYYLVASTTVSNDRIEMESLEGRIVWRVSLRRFDGRFSALVADLRSALDATPSPLLIVAVTSESASTAKAMRVLQAASQAKAAAIAGRLTSVLEGRVQVVPQGLGAASPLDHWQEPRVDVIWLQD